MIDPYLFDNQTVYEIPFENKQRFDYSSDFLNLNNLIKDFNVFNNQNSDQDLNCFTTDQLQKIQNENFKDIEKEQDIDHVFNKPKKNKLGSFTCRCCKVKEKNYQLFGQFCSEICRQNSVKNELAFKKKPSKLAPKIKKKLKNQIKNSSLNFMNENENPLLTDTSDHEQSLKHIAHYSPREAVQGSETRAKYYIPKTHCPIIGCNGQGHVNEKFTSHYSLSGCPYSQQNQKSSSNTVKEEIPKIIIKKIGDSLFASKKFNLEEKIALINQKKAKKLQKKRGRPAKSLNTTKSVSKISQIKRLDKNKAAINFIQGTKTIQENIFNDQKLALKEKEIKESVYLASSNEMFTSSYERPGFKYDSQLLLGINEYLRNVTDNFKSWRVKDVSGFIKSIPGCSEHAHLFESQEIDGEALLLIQEADLISLMNIKLGPAVKIFNYILKLKQISEQFHELKTVDA